MSSGGLVRLIAFELLGFMNNAAQGKRYSLVGEGKLKLLALYDIRLKIGTELLGAARQRES